MVLFNTFPIPRLWIQKKLFIEIKGENKCQ